MIDLGTVRPGSTIRIPFSTFDKDDGSSITMTNFAVADILVYKDGSTTERASTSGYTATTDFDAKTGKHLAIIDLADNTTANFWNAGGEYLVAIDSVTVDAVTTGGWIARFRIGYPDATLDTTIATLSSQTSFTLTVGPAENDALLGCVVLIHDIASAVQHGYAIVSGYTGATKTVTLAAGVTFTAAAGDNISVFPPANTRWLGHVLQTGRDIGASVLLSPGTGTGQLDITSGVAKANATQFAGQTITCSGGVTVPAATLASTTNITAATGCVLSAAGVDAVWDEPLAAHTTADTPGQVVNMLTQDAVTLSTDVALGSIVGQMLDNGTAWSYDRTTDSLEALRDNTGTAGAALTAIDLPDQTMNITGNITGNLSGSVGSVTGAVGSVTLDVNVGGLTAAAVQNLFTVDSGSSFGDSVSGSLVREIIDSRVAPPTSAAIADAVWDEARAGHVAAGSFGEGVASVQGNVTGSAASVTGAVGSVTGAVGSVTGNVGGNVVGSVGSVTGAVGSVTGNVGGNVTGTIGGLTAAALADFFDTNSGTTYGSAVAGSVVKEIADNAGGSALTEAGIADAVWDEAIAGHLGAGSTGAALNGASAPTAAQVADAVWDEAVADHVGAGSTGERVERLDIIATGGAGGLTNARAALLDNLDAAVSTRLATAGYTAPLDAAGTRTAVGLAAANLDTQLDALPTAAENADAVWDEAQAGHVGAGSFGEIATEIADILVDTGTTLQAEVDGIQADTEDIQTRLPAALVSGRIDASVGAMANGVVTAAAVATDAIDADAIAADAVSEIWAGSTAPAAGAIADAVWDEARAGHVGAGSFGEGVASVQGNVTGSTASVSGAVGSVTGNVGGNVTGSVGSVVGAVGSVTGSVGSVTGAVGSVTGNVGGNVVGSVGSVATGGITAASIATDAIDADAIAADAGTELATAVWAAGTRTLTNNGNDPTAAAIADAVWDEAVADHVGAGSTGERIERLDIVASGGSGGLTNARAALLDNLDAAVTTRLAPTTAGRTLDVTATGAAGVDWGNVENPTTTVGLSGTTVKTATDVETDTADIQSRLPAALTGAGNIKADALAIDGSTQAADRLQRSAETIAYGTCTTGCTTTSIVISALDPTDGTADQFKGRIVIFDRATTTAALRGQATDITATDGAGTLTVTALTTAPASGDVFVIV